MRRSLAAVTPVAVTAALVLTGCGGSGSTSAAAKGSTAVTVTASDTACTLSRTTITEGVNTFAITNTGSKVTEVYLYAARDKIVAEKENIGPGLTYQLTTQVPAGSYQVACKPGMTGNGIRTAVTASAANGSTAPTADPAQARAVSQYRSYVQHQADALVPLVAAFAKAVKAGDVARAKSLYAGSRRPWEVIEPVAEAFGDIDPKVDVRQADLEPGQRWTGWHRIEKALWVDGSTKGMGPYADELVAEIGVLRSRIAKADLTVASIANGAKELLDEVATTKVTGEEETFSHTDLVDFAANVEGAHKAFEVLQPLVKRSDPSLDVTLTKAFADVDAALATHRHGSGYVSYATVGASGRRELARVVDALGAPLSELASTATRA